MNVHKVFVLFLALGFILSIVSVSHASDVITLKYANFPPASTFPSVQMERWAREVEKRTADKVKVQTFPGGTLLQAKNIFDGVISGVADIGNFAMSYQPGRFPVSEAIDLPHGFSSAKVATQVLFDIIEKYKPSEFEKVKVLALFTCPPTQLMTKTPIKSLSDLKGVELRVAGTSAEVIKRLGGIPIAMPQSETPEAIQKGVVKGIVSSLDVLKDMKYAAYTQYATIANLPVVSFAVVMNLDKWDALPNDVKKVFEALKKEQSLWTAEYVDNHVSESLKWSAAEYKHQILHLSANDKAQIVSLTKPMLEEYVKKVSASGIKGDDILKDIARLKAKYEKSNQSTKKGSKK